MRLEQAEKLAEQFIHEIVVYCEKIKIVGSIRRRKTECRDIDLVLLAKPEELWNFALKLKRISKINIDGKQVKRVIYKGEQFDLYFASPETWGALVLIRTGSAEHNIALSKRALNMGMKLSHKGLIKDGKIIASTERKIFDLLDLSYVPPEERG
jgi:DNA polymerase/3'-5' exonuclease PolX